MDELGDQVLLSDSKARDLGGEQDCHCDSRAPIRFRSRFRSRFQSRTRWRYRNCRPNWSSDVGGLKRCSWRLADDRDYYHAIGLGLRSCG